MHGRYEDWLDREWGIPRYGSSQQRQPVMRVAEAKRARKAAKRRRDAELTRLGHQRRALSEVRTWDVRRTSLAFVERDLLRFKRRARHRGVRQWWKVTGLCMPHEAALVWRRMRAIRRGEVTP